MKKRIIIILIILLVIGAAVGGIYLIKKRGSQKVSNVPAAKGNPSLPIGKEKTQNTPLKTKPGTAAAQAGFTTKDLVRQASAIVKGRLVRIIFRKMPLGKNRAMTNTLSFIFYNPTENKMYEADYVFESKKLAKNPNSPPVSPASAKMETVPEAVINFGYEGVKRLLAASSDYRQLRAKYPKVVANCADILLRDPNHGWEWRTTCRAASLDAAKAQSFALATNIETKKVVVLWKRNLPE